MKRLIVMDTCFLFHIYEIRGNDAENKAAIKRLIEANNRGDIFYVPTTVIFELANHIAHIDDKEWRRQRAKKLANDIQTSITTSKPYSIVPCSEFSVLENLAKSLIEFAMDYVEKDLSPIDTSVYLEALRLKKKFPKNHPVLVEIWTKEKALNTLWQQTKL